MPVLHSCLPNTLHCFYWSNGTSLRSSDSWTLKFRPSSGGCASGLDWVKHLLWESKACRVNKGVWNSWSEEKRFWRSHLGGGNYIQLLTLPSTIQLSLFVFLAFLLITLVECCHCLRHLSNLFCYFTEPAVIFEESTSAPSESPAQLQEGKGYPHISHRVTENTWNVNLSFTSLYCGWLHFHENDLIWIQMRVRRSRGTFPFNDEAY